MNLKTIATLTSALLASSAALAATPTDRKCGAGSCSKKEVSAKAASGASAASGVERDASCSKKEASCSKKEASCAKKEASCSKK